jgi:aminopeptidase
MSYFVTGGTGFIGHNLIRLLLKRRGTIYVLVRKGSEEKLELLKAGWGKAAKRVVAVKGDLTKPFLGVSPARRKELAGKIDHVFHLAAIYDLAADAASQEAGMSLAEYEDFVYGACFLFENDPVGRWQKLKDDQQHVVDFLNSKKKIRYASADVDVEFSVDGRTWLNSAGTNNMPSGEVFTAPVEDSVNGKVRFSFPGFFMGQEIEDIELEIKDGEVVKWNAGKGKEILDKVFEIDGSRRFGEVAVGMNDGIQKFTKNMLFDEKIGGTIHMAVGAAYPETGGKNESSVHWDMLADMRDGGQIFADDELVYENGKFII